MQVHRLFISAVLYSFAILSANHAASEEARINALEAMREGSMKKLIFHEEPRPVSGEAFFDADGNPVALSDFLGKVVVLNFWATWCAPCRKEMPTLDALQKELGGESLEVVAVATGRTEPDLAAEFLDENGIDSLALYIDRRQKLLRSSGALGLPTTLVIDSGGFEVARLAGDADWASESALAILSALAEGE